jgi:basic membrane protein A
MTRGVRALGARAGDAFAWIAFAGIALAGIALAGIALGVGGCGERPAKSGDRPVVGLVFDVGGLGDKSFNDSAYRGLRWARDSLNVETQAIEPTQGTDREAALRLFATQGRDLIFGIGFLFTDDIRRMAEEFPDRKFACIDYSLREGETVPPNLLAVRFREEEGSFLVGAIAALKSHSGKIGFVGGMDMPLIHRFQAGYEAGARHARPGAEILVGYAGVTGEAFKNPAKGKELALAQYAAGAEVIFHASGSTGLGVFEAARLQRRYAIGVDSDQWDEAPGRVLTSMIKSVDVAVFRTVRSLVEGRFTGGVIELGLAERGVDYVYDSRNATLFAPGMRDTVEAYRAAIIAGEIEVPRERGR